MFFPDFTFLVIALVFPPFIAGFGKPLMVVSGRTLALTVTRDLFHLIFVQRVPPFLHALLEFPERNEGLMVLAFTPVIIAVYTRGTDECTGIRIHPCLGLYIV